MGKHLLSESLKAKIDIWLGKYPKEKSQSAVVGALMAAQQENGGHLTKALIEAVANYIKVFPMQAMEVASFYPMFEHQKVGKFKIEVCHNISCMLNGSDELVDFIKDHLKIKVGEVSTDGNFSFKKVECLGACVDAPIVSVNGHFWQRVSKEQLQKLFAKPTHKQSDIED